MLILTNKIEFSFCVLFIHIYCIQKLKIELRGPDNGLRVRQVKILGQLAEGRKFIDQLPGRVLRAQMCEAEVLKVFKLLTAEVSRNLLLCCAESYNFFGKIKFRLKNFWVAVL